MAEDEEDDAHEFEGAEPGSLKARIVRVSYQRREARQARDTALGEVETLRAQLADRDTTIEGFGETTANLAKYQALEVGWATEKAIMGAGISDPEGVEFARMAYDRLPADSRPKLNEWLSEDNRPNLAKGLRAYFTEPGSDTKTPDPNKGTAGGGGTKAKGDTSKSIRDGSYKADRASIWEEMGVAPPKWE